MKEMIGMPDSFISLPFLDQNIILLTGKMEFLQQCLPYQSSVIVLRMLAYFKLKYPPKAAPAGTAGELLQSKFQSPVTESSFNFTTDRTMLQLLNYTAWI